MTHLELYESIGLFAGPGGLFWPCVSLVTTQSRQRIGPFGKRKADERVLIAALQQAIKDVQQLIITQELVERIGSTSLSLCHDLDRRNDGGLGSLGSCGGGDDMSVSGTGSGRGGVGGEVGCGEGGGVAGGRAPGIHPFATIVHVYLDLPTTPTAVALD